MGYFAKFKTQGGLEFMDNREKGNIEQLATLETFNIDEWGFINGKFGRTFVFTVQGLPQLFFFGNKIIANVAEEVENDGMEHAFREVGISVEKVRNRDDTASYWSWHFIEN